MRIPITRHDEDGTIVDGTALVTPDDDVANCWTISDFRDLDGEPLHLPAGSQFEIDMDDFTS